MTDPIETPPDNPLQRGTLQTPHLDPTISKRVCAAKAEMRRIVADAQHTYAKYRYASTDQVFEAVRPVLAKHGLDLDFDIVDMQIREPLVKGKSPMLQLHVRIGFVGELWTNRYFLHPIHPDNAAQGMGAAQSYILRQYLRGRFQLETGDADTETQAPVPQPVKLISGEQAAAMKKALKDGGIDLGKFLTALKLSGVEMLAADQFAATMKMIEKSAERKREGAK